MSKIAIIGAGAIGGLVGARLALAGEEVTFLVRGANLQAIQQQGITLVEADGTRHVAQNVRATNDYRAAGVQDVVVLGMKAHQVAAVLGDLPHVIGPETIVVPMQNGIPFWYFHGHGGPLAGRTLETVDPGGLIGRAIDPQRVIGCVVYPASELVAPGVIQHIEGDRFPLGELDGRSSARVLGLSQTFVDAGFKAPVLEDIRSEIWLKLWGNLTFNPISALAHATLEDICRHPLSRELAAAMMREAHEVATRLGITFRVTLEKRIAGAEKVGRHKTSMLQDVEAGRAPEIDALVGSVVEIARLTETATPHIDAVHALMKLLGQMMERERGQLSLRPLPG